MNALAPEGLALVAAKSAVLLLLAGGAARLLRRSSAAVRHAILAAGAAGAGALPLLGGLLPGWTLGLRSAPAAAAIAGPDAEALAGALIPAALWAAGCLTLLAGMVRSRLAARRLVLAAPAVRDARILSLAIDLREEIGFGAPLRLLLSEETAVPFCVGALRPRVVLPAEAVRWSRSRLRAVLLHEIAHLARRDCLTGLLAEVCRALYWFLPPAWWNASSMRFLREVACDDRVVEGGARPSGYAAFLLRSFQSSGACAQGLFAAAALGGRHELERRIAALLARGRPRGGSRWAGLTVAIAAGLLSGLVAAADGSRPPTPRPEARWHRHELRSFGAATATRVSVEARVGAGSRTFEK